MFCVKKVVVNMDVEIYFNRKTLMEDYRMSEKTIETALLTGTYRGSMFVEIDIDPSMFLYKMFKGNKDLNKFFIKIITENSA